MCIYIKFTNKNMLSILLNVLNVLVVQVCVSASCINHLKQGGLTACNVHFTTKHGSRTYGASCFRCFSSYRPICFVISCCNLQRNRFLSNNQPWNLQRSLQQSLCSGKQAVLSPFRVETQIRPFFASQVLHTSFHRVAFF